MSRLTINSNIFSLNAQRRLGEATNNLSQSFTRLSSGLRINKASDDAAGLSVASLLTIDRRVTNQGIRNLNDGVSYLNIAESALNELSSILTRISELAEQGANGTLGSKQREALQQEVTSLQTEYNRIIRTTSFNGNQLLTGLNTNTILQGGYGQVGQLAVQVGSASLGIANDSIRAGLTTRIDTDSSGTVGNGTALGSTMGAISADGRYIVFGSRSTNLVEGGTTPGVLNAFVKDTLTSQTILVSTSSSGVQASNQSDSLLISGNGKYVVFTNWGNNLVSGDTNGTADSFVKDLVTGNTFRATTDSNGNQLNGHSYANAISADGRFIGIHSEATNLGLNDTNGGFDVFLKDTLTGELKLVSGDSSGTTGNAQSFISGISDDGRFVSFTSSASNLVTGDTNGVNDAFVKDMLTGVITLVSTSSQGTQGNGATVAGGISVDGRYVTFQSLASNLVSGDTNGVQDIFVKDLQTGITSRISTDSQGAQSNNTSGDVTTAPDISADGRYIYFSSYASNLVTGDTNGGQDSFVKDTLTGETRRVSVDSNGSEGNGQDLATAISADGRYAVFYNFGNGATSVRDLSKTGVQEISGMMVSNQASARITLDLSKKYQEELSSYRAGIGASLSRASTFINTLQVQSENYAAAASQITDVDVAEESSKLTANKILQQAAASVLAQANQQPRLVLRLLEDL